MDYQNIILKIDAGVACLTLNRPQAMNTLTGGLIQEWDQALRQCDNDPEVRVIIVTGSGNTFCAGADLSGGESTFDTKDNMSFSSCPITPAYKLRKPVIAAMNGHAIGAGFSMAMQCDFRIAATEGKYGLLPVQRGVLADGNVHWLLPRMVGMEKALQLHLLGERMDGATLFALGLAMKVVPAAQVLQEARAIADHIMQKCSPLIVGMAKQLCWQSLDKNSDEMEQMETRMLHYTMGRADALEGGKSFMERRQPRWTSSINHDWPTDL